jgi:hypothetical protein
MRFIADENVPRHVLDRLRADRHDVTSIEGPLSGIPDREVLKAAESEGRVLITADRGFGELLVRHRLGVIGVIVFQLDFRTQPRQTASPKSSPFMPIGSRATWWSLSQRGLASGLYPLGLNEAGPHEHHPRTLGI